MPVRRLYIVCEGQMEEGFVNLVLRSHFRSVAGTDAIPLLLPNKRGSKSRRHKGGWNRYALLRDILVREMQEKHGAETWFTTMVDLYAVPDDFPELATAPLQPAIARIAALEEALKDDITTERLWRFTPYLQLHEYEALLLSDLEAIGRAFPDLGVAAVAALRSEIGASLPEEIDGGRDSAPSKRIEHHFPAYEGAKASQGPLIAADIGLLRLRAACPHFDDWLTSLEARCRE